MMKTARQIFRSFFHWETEEEFNKRDKNIPEASSIYGAIKECAKRAKIEGINRGMNIAFIDEQSILSLIDELK